MSSHFEFLIVVEPSVTLRSVEAAGMSHPRMLVCTAYGFYPKNIKLTWLRNGHEVTSDVEHASLMEPKLYEWGKTVSF
uniref:Ig-like domain-containing protein n=1 Tax=Salarias fasciatus TaxID=181472 RepID=A0A672GTW5_SALFA